MIKEVITIIINLVSRISLKSVKVAPVILAIKLSTLFKKIQLILKVVMILFPNRDLREVSSMANMGKFLAMTTLVTMLTSLMRRSRNPTKLPQQQQQQISNPPTKNMKPKNKKGPTLKP